MESIISRHIKSDNVKKELHEEEIEELMSEYGSDAAPFKVNPDNDFSENYQVDNGYSFNIFSNIDLEKTIEKSKWTINNPFTK